MNKYSRKDFEKDFPDDNACLEWLKNSRWPDGIIPREEDLPSIDEFIGSDPDFTGDMSTEEYIRSIRSV